MSTLEGVAMLFKMMCGSESELNQSCSSLCVAIIITHYCL